MDNWVDTWEFLKQNKDFCSKLAQLDRLDEKAGLGRGYTEQICHKIYNDYISNKESLKLISAQFYKLISTYPASYIISSRTKDPKSLVEKVVRKRYAKYGINQYKNLNEENYKNVITDLIGCRIVVHHTDEFISLHNDILNDFSEREYIEDEILNHITDKNSICEEPTFYHSKKEKEYLKSLGYDKYFNLSCRNDKDYRSVHYILSFEHTYIELQIRTIYDDAFSECDHNYVYKHSSEKSVLSNLTDVLSDISIIGNDISDLMRYISVSDLAQKTDSSVKQHNEIVTKQQFDKISEEIILLNTKFDKIKNNY